jgi:uncharacterized membrane-anchored protein
MAISHLVMLYANSSKQESRAHLQQLLSSHQLPMPDGETNHMSVNIGLFRLRWELHTEFASWTFMRACNENVESTRAHKPRLRPFRRIVLEKLPGDSLSKIHLWLLPAKGFAHDNVVEEVLHEDSLVASTLADGHGEVYTDFQIHSDGFSRMLLPAWLSITGATTGALGTTATRD